MTAKYNLAKENLTYYHQKDVGILKISGEDRIDFLHRQSTNDINKVDGNNIITSVLTTPNARIIDVLTIFQHKESLICITLPFRGQSTYEYLSGKIFFMDKVEINNFSDEFKIIDIEGITSTSSLANVFTQIPDLDKFTILEKYNGGYIGGQNGIINELSYLIMVNKNGFSELIEDLTNQSIYELGSKTREIFRIEAKVPGFENELIGDFTPLENKLNYAISNNKGCYTGQEIIARQVNYDKITKNLAQIQLDQIVPIGSKISANGKNAGLITSIIDSPKFDVIALAILKRPYFEIDTELQIAENNNHVSGKVVNISKH